MLIERWFLASAVLNRFAESPEPRYLELLMRAIVPPGGILRDMARLLDGNTGEPICEIQDLSFTGRVTNTGTKFSALVPSATGDDLFLDQELVTIETDEGERFTARVLQHGGGTTPVNQRIWGTARTAVGG